MSTYSGTKAEQEIIFGEGSKVSCPTMDAAARHMPPLVEIVMDVAIRVCTDALSGWWGHQSHDLFSKYTETVTEFACCKQESGIHCRVLTQMTPTQMWSACDGLTWVIMRTCVRSGGAA